MIQGSYWLPILLLIPHLSYLRYLLSLIINHRYIFCQFSAIIYFVDIKYVTQVMRSIESKYTYDILWTFLFRSDLAKPANTLYMYNLTGVLEAAVRATNAQYDDPDILKRLDCRLLEVCASFISFQFNAVSFSLFEM